MRAFIVISNCYSLQCFLFTILGYIFFIYFALKVFDKKAPICNVTSTSGLCNFGSDVCQCSSHTWEMSAVVGDDGDGLQSVFASNAGNSSTFTVDSFSPGKNLRDGLVHAKIRSAASI